MIALPDLLDRGRPAESPPEWPEFIGLVQSGVDAVDAVHLTGTVKQSRVGAQQTYGAGTEDRNVLVRVYVGEGGGVPPGNERVGARDEVVLLGIAGLAGQPNAVDVGPRYAQRFRAPR